MRWLSLILPTFVSMPLMMVGCGPPVQGEFSGVDAATHTQTSLVLQSNGDFTLHFASGRGPQVTLQGRYTSYDPSTLVLSHARLTVADGESIVVAERSNGDQLCAPLSVDGELCVAASHQLSTDFSDEALAIARPPFAFMASRLLRTDR